MDEHGLDMQVLSLTSPGIQAEKDTRVAVTNALKVNDFLKTVIDQHPTISVALRRFPCKTRKRQRTSSNAP